MNQPIVLVVLPTPHDVSVAGPHWTFRAVFGDRVRITGLSDVPAAAAPFTGPMVALSTREDAEPFGEASLFLPPTTARAVAAALLAAARHAEGGQTR